MKEEIPNFSYINKLAKGDNSFVKKLMEIIKSELSGEIATYKLHLANDDLIKTAEDVHKLSHKISILGLDKGYKIAKDYELNLLKKKLTLRSEFERILDAMVLFVKKE